MLLIFWICCSLSRYYHLILIINFLKKFFLYARYSYHVLYLSLRSTSSLVRYMLYDLSITLTSFALGSFTISIGRFWFFDFSLAGNFALLFSIYPACFILVVF